MLLITLAVVLLGALAIAHAVELRRLANERTQQRALAQRQVQECLENIDRVIDLNDHAVRFDLDLTSPLAFVD